MPEPRLRAEAFLIGLMVRFEARDGSQHLWLSPILRTKTGVAVADPMEMPEPPGGRFGSLF